MKDWIARATNSARITFKKMAAVAKDALCCNRWIASSALQKSIRRGDIAIALRAAFALHREDRPSRLPVSSLASRFMHSMSTHVWASEASIRSHSKT